MPIRISKPPLTPKLADLDIVSRDCIFGRTLLFENVLILRFSRVFTQPRRGIKCNSCCYGESEKGCPLMYKKLAIGMGLHPMGKEFCSGIESSCSLTAVKLCSKEKMAKQSREHFGFKPISADAESQPQAPSTDCCTTSQMSHSPQTLSDCISDPY
jgi:hypothetical protein